MFTRPRRASRTKISQLVGALSLLCVLLLPIPSDPLLHASYRPTAVGTASPETQRPTAAVGTARRAETAAISGTGARSLKAMLAARRRCVRTAQRIRSSARIPVVQVRCPTGSAATVYGTGFKANDAAAVIWDCATAACASTTGLGVKPANANGDFSLSVTIPATGGLHALGGKGSSGTFAATTYKVTS